MSQVIDHSEATGSTYLVALMLADHANADGHCWPSLDRLAQRARLGRSTVTRALRELEGLGELRKLSGKGRGSVNHYVVMPGYVENLGVATGGVGQSDPPGVAQLGLGGGPFAPAKWVRDDPLTVRNRKEPRPPRDDEVTPPDQIAAEVARIRPLETE